MAYSAKAKELRQCVAITKSGERCRSYARWGDPQQLCGSHGNHHHGPMTGNSPQRKRTIPLCNCGAYAWPHRPGGGLCRWPDPPEKQCPTPAGTHNEPRLRIPREWRRTLLREERRIVKLPKP